MAGATVGSFASPAALVAFCCATEGGRGTSLLTGVGGES